jgi:ATP-dependent Lhr-like helicase
MSNTQSDNPIYRWFAGRGWTPFPFQLEAWEAYRAGESGLIHAATGTGKTYAAWMGPLLEWLEENPGAGSGQPAPPLRVLWVTPLRALAADTEANLRAPLLDLGLPWTLERRTADVPASVRNRQRDRLPTALVTTPESLSLLLTRPNARDLFRDLRCVVLDEWHELLGSKRGTQVELALARLRTWQPNLRAWGLSATLGNLDAAEAALSGGGPVRRVRGYESKNVRIDALVPEAIERFPWAGHLGLRMLDQVIAAIEEGETALVFTNTRAHTETWYQAILEARPDWAGIIALHHGSLDGEVRSWVEGQLRAGKLRCVVCTSSLDLGVDFSPVDRVIQVGSPKGVARLLQRAGRSGHRPGAESRVTCVPTNAFELVETAAARDAAAAGLLEARTPPEKPLDVLAQHVLTVAVGGGFRSDDLYDEVRRAHAFRDLSRKEWRWVVEFLERGGRVLSAYPEYRRIVRKKGAYAVSDADVARRHRLSVGTILSEAMLRVQYVGGGRVGQVEESFVARLQPGDRFILAGKALEFVQVRDMTAWVRRAPSSEGAIPKWTSGRQPLSPELAAAVRRKLDEARRGRFEGPEMCCVRPILELQAAWSRIPGEDELLIERLKSREGHHLMFYPFEGRLVHEGLAALLAYRLSRRRPITFSFACNDYGFELLSAEKAPLNEALADGLLSRKGLLDDILASLNTVEMARRHFRSVARVAGLIFQGYPGAGKTNKQLQSSSGLLYDVFRRYDPENLLLKQALREVLEQQLEQGRLGGALQRLAKSRLRVVDVPRPTPLGFPLVVDRLRDKLSSEKLADRVRRMQLVLEKAADDTPITRAELDRGKDNPNETRNRKGICDISAK